MDTERSDGEFTAYITSSVQLVGTTSGVLIVIGENNRPLLIPLVLLHDISGKDIPLLVKPSLVLALFSVHPAPLWTLSLPNLFPSLSFFSISLFYLFLSFPLLVLRPTAPSILPYKCGRIWVCGKGLQLGRAGGGRGGLRLSPWRCTVQKAKGSQCDKFISHISICVTTMTAGRAGRGARC